MTRKMCSNTEALNQKLVYELLSIPARSKGGLLEKVLTSIFGVNAEVYDDIDTLRHDQLTMVETMTQLNLLLNQPIEAFNSIGAHKCKEFPDQIEEVIRSVNDLGKWYKKIDHGNFYLKPSSLQTSYNSNSYLVIVPFIIYCK